MKSSFVFATFCLLSNIVLGQQYALTKQWDSRFGGLLDDEMYSCIVTSDSGYLLGGGVYSGIGGDKTQDNWDTTYSTYDFWVVKINSNGNKQWDKRFGGFSDDGIQPSGMHQTFDGGYILSGLSASDSGGDKTQSCWGGFDYWMVKIDSDGNKQWDRRYGGTQDDLLFAMQQTKDGGYIMGGTSYSDSSGDKTQNNCGGTDFWVVKIDSVGNKLWNKTYGGSGDESFNALVQTNDGGYLLGGSSTSGISCDKTQANWAEQSPNFWIVRIDSLGNQLWDERYGGTEGDYLQALIQSPDGGFLLGGSSYSGISGNKTQGNFGGLDYWVIKIDAVGNPLWDKDYGGSADDQLVSLALTNDGGYLIAGNSQSPISGDKTENNIGGRQTWIIKTDSLGNKQWDKTILVNGPAITSNAFQTKNGCYLIGSWTAAEIGYYKTEPSWDSSADYWIVKFCDTIITGITDLTAGLQLKIYPNPFTSDIAITLAQANLKEADFSICNISGQTVYSQHETNLGPSYTKMLDLSYLPNGVYLVEVVVDGEVTVREVVKQ